MFKLTPRDTFGIEKWAQSFREHFKKGGGKKHTEAEKEAIYKECKVGKYREWEFSETRYKEIVDSCQQDNKDQYRLKVYTWLRRTKPELAHLTWEQIVELNLHKQMYGGIGRGKARSTHLEEEVEDVDYM
jgi:hypothetical protein